MKKNIPQEVEYILKGIPVELLEDIYTLSLDTEKVQILQNIFSILVNRERDTIVSIAGSPKTHDELVENAMAQQFSRGRISLSILVNAMIRYAGDFADRKIEEGKGRGK